MCRSVNAVHLWDKVRLSGAGLLQDARWETLKHCRLSSLEQVCRLAADLTAEARQAHVGDRGQSDDVLEKIGFAQIQSCKGVDNEKS